GSTVHVVIDILGYFQFPTFPVEQSMFATVTAAGTLVAGQSFLATGASFLGGNFYEVDFVKNHTKCALVADIAYPGVGGSNPGFVTTTSRLGNVDGIFVGTYNAAGGATPRAFMVHVLCPAAPAPF